MISLFASRNFAGKGGAVMDRDNKLVEGALGLWKILGGEQKKA